MNPNSHYRPLEERLETRYQKARDRYNAWFIREIDPKVAPQAYVTYSPFIRFNTEVSTLQLGRTFRPGEWSYVFPEDFKPGWVQRWLTEKITGIKLEKVK